jgi:DNA-binding CsgD family transcriptional regulator
LTERLQAVFAARLGELDTRTREVLLLAALEGSGRLDVLERAAAARGGLQLLGEAERRRLLAVDDGTRSVRFRHPLVRGAVVGASTHAERRAVHEALAAVFADEPDRHSWHRAAAAAGPDPAVALLLEQAAHRALRRGDGIGAVTTLVRSADLTPDAADRSHRLAEAAYIGANLSGQAESVAPLIDAARLADATPRARLYATLAAATLLYESGGEIEAAHQMLVGGIEAHTGSWDETDDAVHAALALLSAISSFLGTAQAWQPFRVALTRLRRPPADLLLVADLIGDPARASTESLRRLRTELRDLAGEPDPWRVAKLCAAGMFVDGRHDSPEPLLRILRRAADEELAPMMVGHAHHWLAVHHFRTGEWDRARRHLAEGIAGAADFASLTWLLKDMRALLAAAEGDADLLAALDEEGSAWAGPRHAVGVLHALHQAVGLGALGQGRYDEAFRRLAAISPPGTLAPHAQRAMTVGMDLVEAAVRSGRRAEAAAHAAILADAGVAAVSPRLAMLVTASAALVDPDDAAAVAGFGRALALPEVEAWPFDRARVQLAQGERLRRALALSEARTPLRAALATFERLGARPWSDRARAELLATGETRAVPGDGPRLELTAQERQVAELAAGGLTNREIGARLHLSHRTVGSHLHHVFPKLGVTSRAALRDALTGLRETDPGG